MHKPALPPVPWFTLWRGLPASLSLSGLAAATHGRARHSVWQPIVCEIATVPLQVDDKAMKQYSANIADMAKGAKDIYGHYLGSFQAAAETVASKFQAVEGLLRWDALRRISF